MTIFMVRMVIVVIIKKPNPKPQREYSFAKIYSHWRLKREVVQVPASQVRALIHPSQGMDKITKALTYWISSDLYDCKSQQISRKMYILDAI